MKLAGVIMSVSLLGLFVSSVGAADSGCDSESGNGKVCKLVQTTKKITVTCWGCECVDKCVPCPSQKLCTHCDSACDPKSGCCDKGPLCRFRWTEWCPGSANRITVKKLVKYEAVKEIPWYTWVVVDGCAGGSDAAPAAPTKPAPAAARLGDEYPLTQAEMRQVPAMMARLPKTGNIVRTSAVGEIAPNSAAKRPVSKRAPWSLFSK